MKADLTRNSFRYWKHFTRVLMQQGRVQLDADWNEQAAILFHYLRSSAADIIGPFGRPAANPGFVILPLNIPNQNKGDFALSAGHFFVSGILCENTPDPIAVLPRSTIDPALKTLKVTAETLAAQGRFLQKDEVLEIFNAANPLSFAFCVVSDRDAASRSLTLSITSVPDWLGNTQARPCVRRALTYTKQPDFPMPASDLTANTQRTLIYLDVWERLVTFAEDDSIREVALGGADTAARAKLVYQVKSLANLAFDANPVSVLQDKFQPHNRGYLRARVQPSVSDTDPCIISPTSRYRGPENQLYRVEIHRGSGKDAAGNPLKPTFKWSRENGSVVFPILSGGGTGVVTLETLGRDDRFGLGEGDLVEVVDDDYVLLNRAGTLLQVQSIDRSSMKVTLGGTPDGNVGKYPAKHPILRRWDQKQGDEKDGGLTLGTDNAALIPDVTQGNPWLDLEDGVQIQFQQPMTITIEGGQTKTEVAPQYRTGDYWLIPARTATGDVLWPTEVLTDGQGNTKTWIIALPPDGINHYYAPLGVINVDTNGNVDFTGTPIRIPDPFGPLEPTFSP